MKLIMKHAIIVGGSRGIGFAIARKFVKHSINVTLVSRNEENLSRSIDSLQQDVAKNGFRATAQYSVCNIAEENDISKCCNELITREKKAIDILINSAGIVHNKLLVSSSAESMREVLDVNLLGTMLFTKSIVKQMIKQRHGSVITIGSIIAMNGNVGQTIYAASKAGLIGFTKSLAKELGSKGITANLISPGFIETDMIADFNQQQIIEIQRNIALKRIGSPNEVANVAYFLGTSSYITGQVFNVDGGLSLTF